MNKVFYIIIVSLLVSNSILCQESKTVKIKEWKYGFAVNEESKPLYFDFIKNVKVKLAVEYFRKSQKEIEMIKGNLIKGVSIAILKNRIYITNALKEKPGLAKGTQKIKYKIENDAGYVSSDGEKWEKLKIKYFKDTGKKNRYDNPLILVYFECSFFKGEYELGFRL